MLKKESFIFFSRLYPVDKSRVNEFGVSYEEDSKDEKQKKED